MKKVICLLLALCLAAGVLSACGAGDKKAEEINHDQAVISISEEPQSLDPCQGWGHGNAPLIQSTLVEYNRDMTFTGDLSTDYHLSEDGTVWTFSIRDDVKFTDGEPLTASDVVFTFETARDSQSSLDLTFLKTVEATDDHTVVFTLKKPTSSFLNTVAMVGIVPEHAYGPDYGDHPIGSGPFRFVQWNKQEQLILDKNPEYYGHMPALDRVVILFQSEDAAFASVKAGQVDVALTAATLADAKIPGYSLSIVDTVDCRGLTMPMTPADGTTTPDGDPIGNDVTCNLEIRQAIAYAMDRQAIADHALGGFATPCYTVNDGYPWHNPEAAIETDLAYAKKLLSDNGWQDTDGDGIIEKNGVKAELLCLYPSGDSVRQAVSMAAAQQMEQLGIRMTVEGTSWDDITKRMFSNVVCLGWGNSNPYESFVLYHSSNRYRDDFYNPEGYENPQVDAYLEQAMESLTQEEANTLWQKAQWDGTTGTSMKGDCPCVFLVNIQHLYYVRDGLSIGDQQIHPHGSSMPLLQNLKYWQWDAR